LNYPGRELEAMDGASNYHRWILEIFKPFLGQQLVEVGAGLGSFSGMILEQHACQKLSLVEPSKDMYEVLVANARRLNSATRIDTYNETFTQAAPVIKRNGDPDSIIYVNVLEHIADDRLELETVRETLSATGHVFLFVPAFSWLYGAFDERVGHFRRYTKPELTEKLHHAGFEVILSSYFDLPGIAPWWVKYCLLKSDAMGPAGVRLYDRFVVPATRRLESIISPPLGKNVIAIARKR
jgi:2-polyprenyl-3-methyl-5-hydroxy-6-metoxy-1,4-benzoquinol methylase